MHHCTGWYGHKWECYKCLETHEQPMGKPVVADYGEEIVPTFSKERARLSLELLFMKHPRFEKLAMNPEITTKEAHRELYRRSAEYRKLAKAFR